MNEFSGGNMYPDAVPPPDSGNERYLQRGELDIDFGRRTITLAGKLLDLSATEFELLAYLARVAPQVASAQELAAQTQGYPGQTLQEANSTLRYHFYRLRRKIKLQTGRDDLIRTVHGVGYALYERPAAQVPSGLITFLFTDIQDSTPLWEQFPYEMKIALARHDQLVRASIEGYGGFIFKTVGDMFCAAFASPLNALTAALTAQRALHSERWATPLPLRVRMSLHTGPAEVRDGDYFGLTLNHLGRLSAIAHGGQILLTQATHDQVARRLPPGAELRDLGLRRLKGVKELLQIFQLVAPELPAQFPPLQTLEPRPNNLPASLTRFIGREWETREVAALLRRSEVRLVTLTGVGGVGKTRVALETASHMLDEFQDGVFFVPLAMATQVEAVVPAIARALGLADEGSKPALERVREHVRERQLLLVLDNFEHVLDAALAVSDLISSAPHLHVLATSRQALELYGEHQYPIAPLAAPDAGERLTLVQLERYPAAKLFVERARAIRPHLMLTDADAPGIAEICACLDGLPLALELAASRLDEYSPFELAAQLSSRLRFLTKGPRDVPERHRTLRALLDWSYHLLTLEEQALFARLAVFVGGWTNAGADAVAERMDDKRSPEQSALAALAAKHLIQTMPGPPADPRLTMLETIREYARERLDATGAAETVRGLHAAYYTRVVERVEPDLTGGSGQQSALWMCEVEQSNFRAALTWASAQPGNDLALRMVKALWRYWAISSQLNEGRGWMERVLAASQTASPALRAPAQYGLGKLALFQEDYAAARHASETALELYRELGDDEGVAWCLNALGEIAFNQGDVEHARPLLQASLELFTKVNKPLGIAKALDDLGRLALSEGEYARAADFLHQSVELRRSRGSTEGVAVGLVALGELLLLQGDYIQAELHTRESLARYRQLNHAAGILTCLDNLAQLRLAQHDPGQAIALYMEELSLVRDLEEEERAIVLSCLLGLTKALCVAGKPFRGGQALGVYERIAEDVTSPEHQQLMTSLRLTLVPADLQRARAEGQLMALDDLLNVLVETRH